MDFSALLDASGAAIVLGGTLLATLLGSGRRELGAAFAALWKLLDSPFDYDTARAEIARDVGAIRRDGLLRGQPSHSSDAEISKVTDALIHDRSIGSLIEAHERSKQTRVGVRSDALRPLMLAGDMAPVFGMAGTLFSLSQVQYGAEESMVLMASVGMAIITTLYGLLLAHLIFNPLARVIERRGDQEEADRQKLIDWMAKQLANNRPRVKAAPKLERVV